MRLTAAQQDKRSDGIARRREELEAADRAERLASQVDQAACLVELVNAAGPLTSWCHFTVDQDRPGFGRVAHLPRETQRAWLMGQVQWWVWAVTRDMCANLTRREVVALVGSSAFAFVGQVEWGPAGGAIHMHALAGFFDWRMGNAKWQQRVGNLHTRKADDLAKDAGYLVKYMLKEGRGLPDLYYRQTRPPWFVSVELPQPGGQERAASGRETAARADSRRRK